MKRVLITGASGYIGLHCLPILMSAGYEVHAVSSQQRLKCEGMQWHQADLLEDHEASHNVSYKLLKEIRPTHVLHLAWYVEHGSYWSSWENERWLGASRALFRSCTSSGVQRIVAASTCADDSTVYGKAKRAMDRDLKHAGALSNTSVASARIHHIFGESNEDSRRLVPTLFRAFLEGNEPTIANVTLDDLADVRDVATALVSLLGNINRTGIVNLHCGHPITIPRLATLMRDLVKPQENRTGMPTAFDDKLREALVHAKRLHTENK